MMQNNAHGPPFANAPVAYYGAYFAAVPFITPFVLIAFWIVSTVTRFISMQEHFSFDAVIYFALIYSFYSFQYYGWIGFYAPLVWALLLIKISYEKLRASLIFLAILCWTPWP